MVEKRRGKEGDDNHDDGGDDVCMQQNITTSVPSSSLLPSTASSTPLRGVILDRLTTRRLLNLDDTYTELHRVMSLFIMRSVDGDMENTSTMPPPAVEITISPQFPASPIPHESSQSQSPPINHPPHPPPDHTDLATISIVNFESVTPQEQVYTLAHTDILLATHGAGYVR